MLIDCKLKKMIAEMKQHVFLSPLLIIPMKLLTHALPAVLCPAGHTRKSASIS